jgi:hypothetical protein
MPNSQPAIQRRIEQIKAELAQLGPLRPGHLSQQYNVCGTPGCRCKDDPPRKHGPYYQLSYTWQRKSHSEFVRLENLATVRQQLTNYQRLRTLVDEWVALGLNAAQLQRHSDPPGSKPRPKTRISHKTSLSPRPCHSPCAHLNPCATMLFRVS